jgi:hypothetical protein
MLKFLDNFPTGAPSWSEKVNDFLTDEELTEFVVGAISSGAGTVLDTVRHGAAQLAAAATTDDSGVEMQDDAGWIALELGKRVMFEARVKLVESTSTDVEVQSDMFVGISALDASIIASAPTDGIYFRKDDGDALLDCVIRSGSADLTVSLGAASLSSATWYRLGIDVQMDPSTANKGTVTFYVDGSAKVSLTVTGLPTVLMGRHACFQSGNALGTKSLQVDYIAAKQQR